MHFVNRISSTSTTCTCFFRLISNLPFSASTKLTLLSHATPKHLITTPALSNRPLLLYSPTQPSLRPSLPSTDRSIPNLDSVDTNTICILTPPSRLPHDLTRCHYQLFGATPASKPSSTSIVSITIAFPPANPNPTLSNLLQCHHLSLPPHASTSASSMHHPIRPHKNHRATSHLPLSDHQPVPR